MKQHTERGKRKRDTNQIKRTAAAAVASGDATTFIRDSDPFSSSPGIRFELREKRTKQTVILQCSSCGNSMHRTTLFASFHGSIITPSPFSSSICNTGRECRVLYFFCFWFRFFPLSRVSSSISELL